MSPNNTIEEARNRALQKIGRNLAEFQKAEARFRFILASHKVSGTPKHLNHNLQRQLAVAARLPIGHLVERTVTAIHSGGEANQVAPDSSTEPWISVSFSLEGGNDRVRAWRKVLSPIVRERNKLVHKMLGSIDFNSIESCDTLSAALDDQLKRAMPALKSLIDLFANFREMQLEVAQKAMESLPDGKSPD